MSCITFFLTLAVQMKLFASILAIMVFSLAVLPCSDEASGEKEHHHSELDHSVNLEHPPHNHSDGTPDDCPPFCVCECCGTTVELVDKVVLDDIDTPFYTTYSFYYSSSYSYNFSRGIWVPPSIS